MFGARRVGEIEGVFKLCDTLKSRMIWQDETGGFILTASRRLVQVTWWGCQTVDAQYNEGRISEFYPPNNLVSRFAWWRRRFRRPGFFKGLQFVCSIWSWHIEIEFNFIPKYLNTEIQSNVILLIGYELTWELVSLLNFSVLSLLICICHTEHRTADE